VMICLRTSGVSHFWRCLFVFEGDPFDPDSKEIAHGYRLKRIANPSQFAFLAPCDSGGLIVDEIGWRKPFILAPAF
jgi:hypothetical protein